MIGSTAEEIVNWVTTADGCVHTSDATQLDSWVVSASTVRIEFRRMTVLDCVELDFLQHLYTVTRSIRYSEFPVIGYYTTFPILDVGLSNERHYLHYYSNIPLPDISIRPTRRFILCYPVYRHAKTTDLSQIALDQSSLHVYTVSQKTSHFVVRSNFNKYWRIFKIPSVIYFVENLQ